MNRICPIMGLLLLVTNVSVSAGTQTTAATKTAENTKEQTTSENAEEQTTQKSTEGQTPSALSQTWLSTFELGYKRQNDYDDEGNRTFNKNSYIASLNVNGRWNYNDGFLPDDWYFSWLPDDLLHLETGVIFSEAPSAEEKTSIKPTTFNTVTHSVDAYTDLTLGKNMDNYATFNVGLKLGLRTLDNAVSSDELARYWGPGVEFNVYSQDIREGRNTRPRGSLKAYWTRFSDYGTRSGQNVWLIQARFKLAENKPYIISLDAELDKNERDNYSVSFIVRQDTDDLLKFFGF
ncbi:hypothetical protein [Vibrio quintilis]|uniref:Inverse autotransporter beta-domain domain-containing protein n=1 Tax=Vibrio quintilis TaxID=1117707 RepID=A0A1M7Z1A7_9VIBR|nr:hypothetical protein [Vibrio quintilis]SHO58653.1 hypothetical protein VQ7734_04425 [Vibrio quintilis]